MTRRLFALLLLLLAAAACDRIPGALRERLRGETPHERYGERLRRAGLDSTRLGRAWFAAADSTLRLAQEVALPYAETGTVTAEEARAVGLRLALREGTRLEVEVAQTGGGGRVFMDLYELEDGGAARHVAAADTAVLGADGEARTALVADVPRDGRYVLRVHPELLVEARYALTARVAPTLAFPVEGRTIRALQSRFGVARDGGRRAHHGVDIFAPRGTPVLAPARGRVVSTRPNALGGRVAWVRDERGHALYFAHLDSVIARGGEFVEVGDTIGLVGNTGNARSTSPHLHFGIYRRPGGPVDPYPFLAPTPAAPRAPARDAVIGREVRIAGATARVEAAVGDGRRLRVRYADGRTELAPAARVTTGD